MEAAPEAPVDIMDRPLTTREVIEQARAAARAAQSQDRKGKKFKSKAEKFGSSDKLKPLDGESEGRSVFGLGKTREPAGVGLQRALAVAAVAATLSGGYALYSVRTDAPAGDAPERVMEARDGKVGAAAVTTEAAPAAHAEAVVAAPTAAVTTAPQPAATPTAAQTGAALYAEAKAKVEAKDRGGVETMRRAANLGYTPAQFYLAKLYENGELGLKKDIVEARRWTERAAQGGDRGAMHNLALYYYQGLGGAKNPTMAANWFRKAAELGLVDSQYNLAQLYEVGAGVTTNAAEAYKWYLIAGRGGDGDSKAAGQRLKSTLSAEAQVAAERSAFGFRAAAPNGSPVLALNASSDIGMAQRALNRLGYYQGPTDGSASAAFGPALTAYQRDQNLKVTGALDADTSQKLSVFAR
ncbi:MAG: hypothetical protein BGN86_11075 [Caulobacterales bacterium 68-7]|nr:MAG: hypothetical protein BGN86_11075 [Caulobacterales bacterium 68-7]